MGERDCSQYSQNSTNVWEVYYEPRPECDINTSLMGGCEASAFQSVRMAGLYVILLSVTLAVIFRSCKFVIVQLQCTS